jgi:hypothetical protein
MLAQRRWNGKYGEIWRCRFVNQVPLRNGSDAIQVNWCELVITHETTGEILYQNAFITNIAITTENVAAVVEAGRTRWKIENENNDLRALTRYWFFDDWEALFRFMADGPEIPLLNL